MSEQDIKEICYDLTDDGKFTVKVITDLFDRPRGSNKRTVPKEERNCITILHRRTIIEPNYPNILIREPFTWTEEIRDTLLRLTDVLGERLSYIYFYGVPGHRPTYLTLKKDTIEKLNTLTDKDVNGCSEIFIYYK